MLSGTREAGCFREVAALHSDHLRQVPLYYYVCKPLHALRENLGASGNLKLELEFTKRNWEVVSANSWLHYTYVHTACKCRLVLACVRMCA